MSDYDYDELDEIEDDYYDDEYWEDLDMALDYERYDEEDIDW